MTEQIASTTIQNNFDCHVEENSNWSCRIDFDPVDRVVRIYDFFGNGQSMATYNGTERAIGSNCHCNVSNIKDLVALLEGEEAQGYLNDIAEGFETYWDGSNHRGRLNENAAFAEEKLGEMIEDWFSSSAVNYYSAEDWFEYSDVVAEMMKGDHDVESYVAEQEARAESGQVDEDDLRRYVQSQLEEAADNEDNIEQANFARKLLGKPEVTTLWAEWERLDEEDDVNGVTFARVEFLGKKYVEIDDRNVRWLACEEKFDEAMEKIREIPEWSSTKREDGWWYTCLCDVVPNATDHDQELSDAFRAYLYGN